MRRRPPRASLVLVVLGVSLAVLATMLLRSYLDRLATRAAAQGPGRTVVVAATDLARGTQLSPEVLSIRDLPAPYVPPGAVGSVQEAAGRSLAADVVAGEVVTRARLAPDGGPVAALVPPGLRAVVVSVSVPPYAIAPGDRVDVLATYATGQAHTEVVVEGAEVLMVRPASGDGLGEGASLVLLVASDTAARLAYARAFADLSVALGPPGGVLP